ncbi:PREDICTED: non-specific lipid-transfer protein A-like [Tarenaya hassleriana]|uniref:non-specific lipid-transfer protein A-like n=1 Tax=Tarenaya hassleriana TaxID=28532 RepID=UPI00053C2243|nr:PREDICTED: non-specific lipid-transfer protein A-like [Tarenaya hassleriana]
MKGAVIIPSLVVLVFMFQSFMTHPTQAAITCGEVDRSLVPCIVYLQNGGSPSAACCAGVRNIEAITPTTTDRQVACECLKLAAQNYPNFKEDAASTLPAKCGVTFNIPISKATNCKSIQ